MYLALNTTLQDSKVEFPGGERFYFSKALRIYSKVFMKISDKERNEEKHVLTCEANEKSYVPIICSS